MQDGGKGGWGGRADLRGIPPPPLVDLAEAALPYLLGDVVFVHHPARIPGDFGRAVSGGRSRGALKAALAVQLSAGQVDAKSFLPAQMIFQDIRVLCPSFLPSSLSLLLLLRHQNARNHPNFGLASFQKWKGYADCWFLKFRKRTPLSISCKPANMQVGDRAVRPPGGRPGGVGSARWKEGTIRSGWWRVPLNWRHREVYMWLMNGSSMTVSLERKRARG